ncbi:MAG: hypothetical protein R3190_18625, partial [Thermoanaerobaculia bacterium]|nr:hypothetical protein [Thermoanaerobaculia bacterium]
MPGHVFRLDRRQLSYAHFPHDGQRRTFGEHHSAELSAETFGEGPLGGSLRDPDGFREALRGLRARATTPVTEASLVLPDDWLRISFVDVDSLPRSPAERQEVLRWKLKRQVPFRVEDLRLSAAPAPALATDDARQRIALLFGVDQLLTTLEAAFEAEGVHLGQLTNQSLSLLAALAEALAGVDLAAVVVVGEETYSLTIARHGEPLLYRHKTLGPRAAEAALEPLVRRDLRLTASFLEENLGGAAVDSAVVLAPPEREEAWSRWLEETFEVPLRSVAREWSFLAAAAAA